MRPAIERIWLEVALPVRRVLPEYSLLPCWVVSAGSSFCHRIDPFNGEERGGSAIVEQGREAPDIESVLAGRQGRASGCPDRRQSLPSLFGPRLSSAAHTWISLSARIYG